MHDYESQAAVISEQLAIATVENPNSKGVEQLQAKLAPDYVCSSDTCPSKLTLMDIVKEYDEEIERLTNITKELNNEKHIRP